MKKLTLLLTLFLLLTCFTDAQTPTQAPTPAKPTNAFENYLPKKPSKPPETAEEFFETARWIEWYDRNQIEAIRLLDTAISMKADFVEAYNFRGRLKFELKRYKAAIEDFDIVIQQVPESVSALQQRAEVKIALKDFAGAMLDLDMSVSILAAGGGIQYNAFEKRGKLKYLQKDYAGAIEDFNVAARISQFRATFFRALTYYKKGDVEAAIVDFTYLRDYVLRTSEETRRLNPDQFKENQNYPANENPLATLSEKSESRKTVVETYGDGEIAPACSGCVVPKQLKFSDKIVPDNWFFSKEYTNLPPSPYGEDAAAVFYYLGSLLEQKGDREQAIAEFTNSIIEKRFDDGLVRYRRGVLLLQQGEFERAVKDLSWAVYETRSPAAYLERGIAIFMLGHDALAQKDFDVFLKRVPDGKQILSARIEEATKRRAELKKRSAQSD